MYINILYVIFGKSVFSEMGGETDETLDTPVLYGIVRNTKRHKTKTSEIKFLRGFSVGSDGFEPPKSKRQLSYSQPHLATLVTAQCKTYVL